MAAEAGGGDETRGVVEAAAQVRLTGVTEGASQDAVSSVATTAVISAAVVPERDVMSSVPTW
jgi:hypothetical protein